MKTSFDSLARAVATRQGGLDAPTLIFAFLGAAAVGAVVWQVLQSVAPEIAEALGGDEDANTKPVAGDEDGHKSKEGGCVICGAPKATGSALFCPTHNEARGGR